MKPMNPPTVAPPTFRSVMSRCLEESTGKSRALVYLENDAPDDPPRSEILEAPVGHR
jgi:hypothetical protein